MKTSDRAKIFMPFDALKGFRELLSEEERIIVNKKELMDEAKEDINYTLKKLNKNDLVKVIYYDNYEYIEKIGVLVKIDIYLKYIEVVDTKIYFNDIYDIKIISKI